jgi:hypothetical protein
MKTKKVLKRIAAIESWISKVKGRSAAPLQELLRDAEAAVARAKEALRALSLTAKRHPAKSKDRASKPTPESTQPKRNVSAPGKKAARAVTKKRRTARRAVAKRLASAAPKKAAVRKATAPKVTAVKAKGEPTRKVEKATAKKAPVKAAKPPAGKVATKAQVKKGTV